MRIGVVIPAFNAEQWIGEAIASVLAQTHRDWSLAVVDDGSTDGTGDIVARFSDPRIRVVRQGNAGVAAARNRGVAELHPSLPLRPSGRRGQGEVEGILFLDADDWLAPDALTRLAATLDAAPGCVAASGAFTFAHTGGVRIPTAGDILERLLVRNLFANGGHLLIRTKALHATGGFLPGIAYGEDWEFWIRIALLGPFAGAAGKTPVLFVRQHEHGAYQRLALNPESFAPCMDAIFGNPALISRFGPVRLAAIRRRTEAENAWIVGRELIRHGEVKGQSWLWRSFRYAPSLKRAALLIAARLRVGPFAPYPVA